MPVTVVVRTASGGGAAANAEPSLTFDGARVVIGRGSGSDVRLPDPSVSTRHATIRANGNDYAIVAEGDSSSEVILVLDGVVRVEVGGERMAEYGPGAILGERSGLEGGGRTATLVAVTPCRVASVPHEALDRGELEELSKGHRREDQRA